MMSLGWGVALAVSMAALGGALYSLWLTRKTDQNLEVMDRNLKKMEDELTRLEGGRHKEK